MPKDKTKALGILLGDYHCVKCKKLIRKFRDEASQREWQISGLCQECQDAVFMEDQLSETN